MTAEERAMVGRLIRRAFLGIPQDSRDQETLNRALDHLNEAHRIVVGQTQSTTPTPERAAS